jgi:uncharacterized phage protein (TIGR02220 family)
MENGWISLHRKMLANPVICKDSDHLAVWVYLLLSATHKGMGACFKGKRITLNPGQLITGRKSIAKKLGVNESKVKRILILFESEHQIDRQRSNKNSLVTVLNWDKYQNDDQQDDQQVTSKWPASDQQVTTNNNVIKKQGNNVITELEIKNIGSPGDETHLERFKKIIGYLNSKTGKSYKHNTAKVKTHLGARLNEGYTDEECFRVIDNKCVDWLGQPKEKFLRPETIFGNKFDGYLNEGGARSSVCQKCKGTGVTIEAPFERCACQLGLDLPDQKVISLRDIRKYQAKLEAKRNGKD